MTRRFRKCPNLVDVRALVDLHVNYLYYDTNRQDKVLETNKHSPYGPDIL